MIATLASLTAIAATATACGQQVAESRDPGSAAAETCATASRVAMTNPAVVDGIAELTGNLDQWQGYSRSIFAATVIDAQEESGGKDERGRIEVLDAKLEIKVDKILWTADPYKSFFQKDATATAKYHGFTGRPTPQEQRGVVCSGDKILIFAGDGEANARSDQFTAYAVVPINSDGTVTPSKAAPFLPPEISGAHVDRLASIFEKGDSARPARLVSYLGLPLYERKRKLLLTEVAAEACQPIPGEINAPSETCR